MTISVLSFYSGRRERGVETWAANLKIHLKLLNIKILSGWDSFNPGKWFPAEILVPTNGRIQVALCRLVTWVLNKPMIVFGHSGRGADDKWNLLCCPNVFVCFTRAQAEWAARFKLPWTRIEVIPHAVDNGTFTSGAKSKNPTVLCVAANYPAKRTELVAGAVKLLPGVKLRIVGSGQPELIPFEKMPEVYKKASVFCFVPEPWEAFGLVFLEAMASNLPVVTTDDPIRREIIGNAGIFVSRPENPAELAVAIRSALSQNWDNLPRTQAAKFSWDRIAKLYDLCFHNCLK
ncbi:glycosyltransferase family 4 protein [Candidatus Amesbacteria bacterium]|nr:glycosyltransferase family 4 protein [Candidatus Amesbacteria bacterium]